MSQSMGNPLHTRVQLDLVPRKHGSRLLWAWQQIIMGCASCETHTRRGIIRKLRLDEIKTICSDSKIYNHTSVECFYAIFSFCTQRKAKLSGIQIIINMTRFTWSQELNPQPCMACTRLLTTLTGTHGWLVLQVYNIERMDHPIISRDMERS